jgi:histidine ammonia-lyase
MIISNQSQPLTVVTANMLKQGEKPGVVPQPLLIDGNSLTLEDVERVALRGTPVKLSSGALGQIERSRALVEKVIKTGEPIYGVTTGFGKFKDVTIKPEDSRQLQRNFLMSHAAGMGPKFDTQIVRAAVLLRANALAKGFSGIRHEVVTLLLECLNKGIHPCIPQQGSLGASGDLAPLAHLALVLIGEGEAEYGGKVMTGGEALALAGLNPVILEAKEGLALTNGTQIMSAMGSLIVQEADRLAKVCDIIGAMSLEAQLGSVRAFHERIHQVRPHPGQMASAENLRRLLQDSMIVASHANCPMVQDAYSLRCMPQVHGASRQAFRHAREVFEIEVNSATDNPLVFEDSVMFGGNFHGQPLAIVLDYLAIALSELANISERRTERLVNPALSNGLPAFLTKFGGLNSGFMIAQYTAAAIVSENKSLAHPASVDSIPTSANQEDHVSMGATAGRKAYSILTNLRRVLAIELLCAAQGLDFRMQEDTVCNMGSEHSKLLPGPGVLAAHKLVREHIPFLEEDRQLHIDMATAEEIIASGKLLETVEQTIGDLN